MYIRWSIIFETGISEIDSQHKVLIQIINDLFKINDEKELSNFDNILLKLQKYADFHFSYEEILMEKYNFPYIVGHIKIHEEFRERIKIYKKEYTKYSDEAFVEIMTFLKDWLINHILDSDRKYISYVNE